ncbi:MAG: PAS domain-containing protein, partial [Planctomycetota bacterium]
MSIDWTRFKRFWSAEEVPRWFGFSLVLVYLVGLGAVGYFGIARVRQDAAEYAQRSGRYAVLCLLDRLKIDPNASPLDNRISAKLERELYDFAALIRTTALRIVDGDRRVVASIDATEVGTIAGDALIGVMHPTKLEVTTMSVKGREIPDRFFRAPLTATTPAVKPTFYLEARLPTEPGYSSALVNQAGTFSVVLVAMGVLFGLYRCLRAQLRSASRIADRLRTHQDRIEQDIASLRLADTPDALVSTWNELIDSAQSAFEAVQRREADSELAQVLERSTGGALATALNALPDGIIYVTDETRIEYMNSAACRLFGWDTEEAKRTSLSDAHAQGVGARMLEVLRDSLSETGSFEAHTAVAEACGAAASATSTY